MKAREIPMYEDFYIDASVVPKVFRDADRIMEEKYKPVRIVNEPIEVPMPRIKGCPGAIGPVHITEDWYIKEKQKKMVKRAKEKKDLQIEMIQLLAQKDRLRFKLGELNPASKRDSKMIAKINIRLKDIDCELDMLETQSGVHIDELDKGTKVGRFLGRMKRMGRKICKKIKRFYRNNSELICGIATVILPIIGSFIVKRIFKM